MLRLVGLVAAMATAALSAQTNAPPPRTVNTLGSRYYELDLELRDLQERRQAVKAETDLVAQLLDALTRAKTTISNSSVPDTVPQGITTVKSQYQQLMSTGNNDTLYVDNGPLGDFLRSVDELEYGLYEAVRLAYEEPQRALMASAGRESRDYYKYSALLENGSRDDQDFSPRWMADLRDFRYARQPGQALTKSALGSLFERVRADVEGLTSDRFREYFDASKVRATQNLDQALTRVNAEKTRLEQELGNIDQQMASLRGELDQSVQAQSTIDKNLTYAIFGMIGVLVLLFLSLRLFHENIAGQLIEKRSLVEVLSMAFMLLTIIILGTGGKIGGETLGTLLGMIAGYIFGRRMGAKSEDDA